MLLLLMIPLNGLMLYSLSQYKKKKPILRFIPAHSAVSLLSLSLYVLLICQILSLIVSVIISPQNTLR